MTGSDINDEKQIKMLSLLEKLVFETTKTVHLVPKINDEKQIKMKKSLIFTVFDTN